MLVACRLAGLSALGAHYAGVKRRAQSRIGCGFRPLLPAPTPLPTGTGYGTNTPH